MLKLNLLPSSHKQGGSVQSVAFLVLVVWLLLLAAMAFYSWNLKGQTEAQVKIAADQDSTIKHIADLKASQTQYDTELSKIKPETEFLNDVAAEPRQITDIMRIISRATPRGVVIQSYSLAPGKTDITLNAFAMNYAAANAWRFDLYTDPDFTDVKFPSLAGRGGCGASANGGGAASGMGGGGYPGMGGGGGGYPGMGGRGPSVTGFAGGPAAPMGGMGGGGSTSQSSYPCSKFPDGRTLAVTVVIKTPYTEPTFPPAESSAGGGGESTGGMGGMGYPGMGAGGYPGMGGGGYPGMGGGAPPSSGTSTTTGTTTGGATS